MYQDHVVVLDLLKDSQNSYVTRAPPARNRATQDYNKHRAGAERIEHTGYASTNFQHAAAKQAAIAEMQKGNKRA